MRIFRVEEIAKALIENESMERDVFCATYFLHITDAGEILPTKIGANKSFKAKVDVANDEDWDDWGEDFETLENYDFRDICENLAEQANEYLETRREEPRKLFYAVIGNEQNLDFDYDCGDGSEDLDEAIEIAEEHEDGAFIAVMDISYDNPMQVGEIRYNDFTGEWEQD